MRDVRYGPEPLVPLKFSSVVKVWAVLDEPTSIINERNIVVRNREGRMTNSLTGAALGGAVRLRGRVQREVYRTSRDSTMCRILRCGAASRTRASGAP